MLVKTLYLFWRNIKRSYFALRRVLAILWQTIKRFESTERRRDAQALTYTTLFALVPVLTVIFAILSIVPALHDWAGSLNTQILSYVMPQGSERVSSYLVSFSQQAKSLTWVGVLVLFLTALMLLRSIEVQFNRIWNVDTPRTGVQTFFRYWAVLSLGPVLMVGALALSSVIASQSLWVGFRHLPFSVHLLPWLISVIALSALYMLVPNCRVPWRNALIAALLIALLLEGGKFLFARILGLFPAYKLIYGAFAAVPLFLLWVYMAWLLVLFGAELSYALSHYTPVHKKLPRLWQRLYLIDRMLGIQKRGLLFTEAKFRQQAPELTAVQTRQELHYLQQKNYVAQAQEGQWLWLINLELLPLVELLRDMTQTDLLAPLPEGIAISTEQKACWQEWQKNWRAQSEAMLCQPATSLFLQQP